MMQPDWKKPMLVENKYLLPDPAYGEVKELIVIIGEAVVISSEEEGEQEDDEEEKDEEGDLDLRSHKNCHCLSKKRLIAEVAMHESASAIVAGGALVFNNGKIRGRSWSSAKRLPKTSGDTRVGTRPTTTSSTGPFRL